MSVTYNYDSLGRVSSLYLFTDLYTTTTFAYYPNDQLKGIQYGNGLVANYTYNNLGLVRRETLNNTSTTRASSLMILNYQYNRTGTVASLTGQVNGTSLVEQYGYDVLRRLVNSYLRSGSTTTTTSYTYDNVGNRLSQKLNGILTSYNYNTANNELTRSASPQSTTVYGYDQNGQLTTKNTNTTSSTVHWTYRWDVPGNLLQPANDSGVQAYYAYDGIGRRLESVESPYSGCGLCRMYYAYLGAETLAEIQPMQSIENDYVYASGIRIARAFNQNGVVQSVVYYHQDALGSTRLVTSNTKTVLFADDYQPYGLDIGASGSETYRFTGKPVSQTTGLYYEYQRWYDPSIGRFISADPVAGYLSDPQSLNPYVYTENLPTGFIDPSGTDDCSINPLSWLGCASNAWNTLSPEEQQGLLLTGFVALTWATGGTDLLFVGGIFALGGVGLYADVTYAEGGTPTIAGALGAANLGFGLGTGVYAFGDLLDTGLSIGTLSQGERLAANRAAGLAFEGRIADAFDVTRNIGPGRLAVQGIETAGSAVPDFATGILGEAKYSNYVSLTRQIKILIEAASKTDTKELFLFTREDTRVSSNVWLWAAKYRITLYKIPWV